MRVLKWLLGIMIGIIILLLIIAFLLFTQPGFKATAYIATRFTPGKVSYQNLQGSLAGPLQVDGLDYQHDGKHIQLKQFSFNWKPWQLIHKKLIITDLVIRDATIITPQPATPTTQPTPTTAPTPQSIEQDINDFANRLKQLKPQPLQLPLEIEIHHALLENIKIGEAPDQIETRIKKITINGTINDQKININITAHITEPQPLYAELRATGNLQHYVATIHVRDTHGNLTMNVSGNQDGIAIMIPQSAILQGSIVGNIKLSWYPIINWNILLTVKNVDLQPIDEQLPKPISLDLNSQGKLQNGNPQFDLKLNAVSKRAQVSVDAHHHQQWSGTWSILIPEIQRFYADGKGSVKSHGTFSGTIYKPNSSGHIVGARLYIAGIAVGKITGDWNIAVNKNHNSTVNMHLDSITVDDKSFKQLDIKLHGNIVHRKINALITLGKDTAIIKATAHYKDGAWKGTLAQLNSKTPQFGIWKMNAPAAFEYSSEKAYIQPICLYTHPQTYFCMQGKWQQSGGWHFSLNTKNFSFAGLEQKFVPALKTTSSLDINAQASGTGSDIDHATANIVISPGILTNIVDNNVINTSVRRSIITILINQKIGLDAKVNFNFNVDDQFNIHARIPKFTDYDIPFKDKQLFTDIDFIVHNFTIASVFEHTIKTSRGRFVGHFTYNGPIDKAKMEGNAKLFLPEFEYTMVKVHAFNINAHLHVDGNKLTYGLVGYAFNNAPLYFSGDTTLGHPYALTHFYVHCKNAEAIKTDDLSVFADSNLKFLLTHDQLDITGNIEIPKATLAPLDFSSVDLMPVNQVTYIGLPKDIIPETSRRKILDLTLAMGKNVYFKAFGAVANLKGLLKLKIDPQKGPVANGQIRIADGKFDAYGQKLKIVSGSSVSYHNNPVTDPYIDARAYKQVTNSRITTGMLLGPDLITVGLHIHGTISSLQFTPYSLPVGLSEADILSYLILGMTAENSNAATISLFFNTATGMIIPNASTNSNADTSSILKWLKSTRISMHNETVIDIVGNPVEAQSSLIVQNQLAKNLYFQYSLGILIPESIFSVRYDINKHWSIQPYTGTGYNVGTGADILYRIED